MQDMVAKPLFGSSNRERRLAIYSKCAVITDSQKRKACCDTEAVSEAGRKFCYNEVVYPAGEFDSCIFESPIDVFDCCEKLGGDNKYYIYDCEVSIVNVGCSKGATSAAEAKQMCDQNFLVA